MSVSAWAGRIPAADPGPAVWLLGAHGGAGVSTLSAFYGFAGDCQRRWPSGTDTASESPFVVVVAQETMSGLAAAHKLILQHEQDRLECALLGAVTIAAGPSGSKAVRQYRDIVVSAAPEHWAVSHHPSLIATSPENLPTWQAAQGLPAGGARIPADVVAAGAGIISAIQRRLPTVLR